MALVRLLARMRTYMNLKIFSPGKGLFTEMTTMRLLLGVSPHMDKHLVAGIKATITTLTSAPTAIIESI